MVLPSSRPEDELALGRVREGLRPMRQTFTVVDGGRRVRLRVSRVGVGALLTRYGRFYQSEFEVSDRWRRYAVLFPGELGERLLPRLDRGRALPLRIDSGCDTGQTGGDLTCDCRAQLDRSLQRMARRHRGFVIRVPEQEGKGWGLHHKLAAHWLQEQLGISNLEAVSRLDPGAELDQRTYGGVAAVLRSLGVPLGARLQLMTNNPEKVRGLEANGFRVVREPLVIRPTPLTRLNLMAKQRVLHHIGLVPEEKEERRNAAGDARTRVPITA
ncbi:MAG: hypothetical protein KGI98_01075 [Euryarchaeota archaeon]|nr:hypothetical protein [Euryarchaeota archaeon]MDE1879362.1 hypothetical protein [Euryarchaeota archaeon]